MYMQGVCRACGGVMREFLSAYCFFSVRYNEIGSSVGGGRYWVCEA